VTITRGWVRTPAGRSSRVEKETPE